MCVFFLRGIFSIALCIACIRPSGSGGPLVKLAALPKALKECSGLIRIDPEHYVGLNDSGDDAVLYRFTRGREAERIQVLGASNMDWEELCADSSFLFIADTGNNGNTRDELSIYRVPRTGLDTAQRLTAERIRFTYPGRMSRLPSNRHNYDCEAVIALGEYLFLFSKNRLDQSSDVYRIPAQPGTYQATWIGRIDSRGLITGADWRPAPQGRLALVLIGYQEITKNQYEPFVLYSPSMDIHQPGDWDFLRFDCALSLQTETILFDGDTHVQVTNESEHGDPGFLWSFSLE